MRSPRAIQNSWTMSINNTFQFKRFMLLYRQQMLQNSRLLIFGTIGYCGVILIILTLATFENQFRTLDPQIFFPIMAFLSISFGVLYNGYAFPALRNKESTISYMTLPASTLEKFLLEFINRIMLSILVLPILYWIMYNTSGYFMSLVLPLVDYEFVGVTVLKGELGNMVDKPKVIAVFVSIYILFMVLPFTGASFFSKQPLIKTLFSLATIVIAYICMIYVVVEPLGLKNYMIDDDIALIPTEDNEILIWQAAQHLTK